jgi:uncharacterized protein (TIGR03790 family)
MQFMLRSYMIPLQVRLVARLVLAIASPFFFVSDESAKVYAAVDESNVLVLYNADQGTTGSGYQIANYYKQVHPGANVVGLTGVNSLLTGPYGEGISGQNYLDVLRPQILSAINSISSSIDVIVTTKGLPLRIDAGSKPAGSNAIKWSRFSSLESELARIDSIDSIDTMGEQYFYSGFPQYDTTLPSNPYYATNAPYDRADPQNGGIRLTSRLDGYDVNAVKNSITRAQSVYVVPFGHYVIVDDDPTASVDQMVDASGLGPGLTTVLQSRNQAFLYDNTDNAVTTAPGPVIGYVSHGVNDGPGGLSGGRYVLDQLNFNLAKGAVFLSHESYNAYSFSSSFDPAAIGVSQQGRLADWITAGGTAAVGHVTEPYNGPDNVTNEDLLFQMLLPLSGSAPGVSGLTWVEAAWNATRQVSYVNTVIGDPLMRFKTWLPGDANLDGVANFADLGSLTSNFSLSGSFAKGNFNGDAVINYRDLGILSTNWGVNAGATSSSNDSVVASASGSAITQFAVPEPNGFALLLIASFLSWIGKSRAIQLAA